MSPAFLGALKSKTVWLGILTAVIGIGQMPEFKDLIAEFLNARAAAILNVGVGILVIYARAITTDSLADKGEDNNA